MRIKRRQIVLGIFGIILIISTLTIFCLKAGYEGEPVIQEISF